MFPFGKIISGIPWQDARPIKIASPALCLDIDHTTVASSGTVYAVDIDSTNTTAGINNYRALAVDLTMGANCNGPYAAYFRTDCVTYQVGGLGAAMGMELCLPGATCTSGEFHGMTIDFECPTSFAYSAGKHSFIKCEIWGDTTAKNNFDDYFNLFFLNGMTSGAGNLVSANEQTLRINIEGTSRYLALSTTEDDLTLAATTHLILPLHNDATTPTLAFGDGNTGFYESSDNTLAVAIGGYGRFSFAETGGFQSNYSATAPRMANFSPSATYPTFQPNKSDSDTGLGHAAADQLSLIAGGIEGLRLTESGGVVNMDIVCVDDAVVCHNDNVVTLH